MSQLGNGRVDIFSVLGLFFVIRVCPLSCAVKRGCGFRCVGGIQNFEHPPTDIPIMHGALQNLFIVLLRIVSSALER